MILFLYSKQVILEEKSVIYWFLSKFVFVYLKLKAWQSHILSIMNIH